MKIAILDKFDANRVCLFRFKKNTFVDRVFTLMLVYIKQSMETQEFFQTLLLIICDLYLCHH